MHPILFRVPLPGGGSFDIASYGVMMAIGAVVCVLIAMRLGKREDVAANTIIDIGFWGVVCGVIGAKIWFIAQFWGDFQNKWDIISSFRSGLVYYGGLIGGAGAIIIYLKAKRLPILKTMDLIAAPGILGLAFGRVGCFLNGCCFGRATASPFSVVFPKDSFAYNAQCDLHLIDGGAAQSLPVFPTQLMESFLVVCLFFALLALKRTRRVYGEQVLLVFMLYPVIRFTVEMFRGDNPKVVFGVLSIPQAFSIASFLIAGGALMWLRRARPKALAVT